MRASTCLLLPKIWRATAVVGLLICAISGQTSGQVTTADGTSTGTDQVTPVAYTTSGSYFNRELGTPLRFSYHSEGYGTETGVVSLGGMKVINMDSATWFLDAQGTLSDSFGGGFNAGLGYREMVNFNGAFDAERILGASFWTDGQSTKADNFFTQLGFGIESLGESFDLRLNGYFPLDRTQTGDPEVVGFQTPAFFEHGLFSGVERITTDTAYDVVDGEFAKRIGDLDAWATAAIYYLGGGPEDETGYRIGFRGYALPDLLVGLQVTDDDIYSTNVMFSITWFVGRTHSGNAPCGILADRFREPVMRNDFIATTSQSTTQGIAELTNADNDAVFDFLHVNSSADPGGDGTIENPFRTLAEANAAQSEYSIVYVHGGSTLNPADTMAPLDNVKVLGEGINQNGDTVTHVVDTVESGTVTLPETSSGASSLSAPIIDASATADLFVLSDNNEINNFTINNATNAVVADPTNANNPTEAQEEIDDAAGNSVVAPHLANLDINNPTGIGVNLTDVSGSTVVENTVTVDVADAGATAMLVDGGTDDMSLAAQITAADGQALTVQNRTGGTITYSGALSATGGTGVLVQNNTDAAIDFTETVELTTGDNQALTIQGNNAASSFTFADLIAAANDADTVHMTEGGTLTINDANDTSSIANTGTGTAFFYDQVTTGTDNIATISVAADITNTGSGNAVNVANHENDVDNNVTFSGTIDNTTDNSDAVVLTGNTGGTIAFDGKVTSDTTTGTGGGVNITAGGADVTYTFTDIDITTDGGTGFLATGDGTLEVTSAAGTNAIATDSGTALDIEGLAIGANNATFDTIDVTGATSDSVILRNLDGAGQVAIGGGTDPGDGGTIVGAAGNANTAITVDNADNVLVENVSVSFDSGRGVSIVNQDGGTVSMNGLEVVTTTGNGVEIGPGGGNSDGTITFANLDVTSGDGDALTIEDNTGGTNIFTDLTAETTGAGNAVTLANNDGATTTINNMTVTASGTGNGFTATNKGTLVVTGTTNITTSNGSALDLNDITVDTAGVEIDKLTVSAGTTDSVSLVDLTGSGSVTVGADTTDPGTITTSGRGVLVDGGANNITINTDVTTTGAANAFEVTNRTGGSVNMNGTVTATGTGGMLLNNNTGGTINVNDALSFDTGASDAITISGNNGATINLAAAADIDLNSTSGSGVHLTGANSTVAIAGDISGGTGTAVDIEGNATAAFTGNITNSAGRSVQVHNLTAAAGTVTFGGAITDTGTGMSIDNNAGGTLAFNGKATLTTGNNDALTIESNTGGDVSFAEVETTTVDGDGVVVQNNTGGTTVITDLTATTSGTGDAVNITNNTGATVTINGMTLNATGTGNGFTASGGGTLAATGTNTVSTTTGVGVNINGMTIDAAGASFSEVNVNGAANGVTLTNTTGGQIRVGAASATGIDGDGGTLSTTGNSIVLSGVRNAVFHDVTANSSAGSAVVVNHTTSNPATITFDNLSSTTVATSLDGVVVNDNGAGELDVTLDNSDLDTQVSNTIGFLFNTGASTGEVDIRLRGNQVTANNASAASAVLNQGSGDVQFLVTGNSFTNNDAAAAVSFVNSANRNLNATVGTQGGSSALANSFSNGTGVGLALTTNSASSRISLDLRGNTANGGGAIDYQLTETLGDFGVVQRAATLTSQTNNVGTVDLGGGVATDFDDLSPPIKQVD